MDVAEVQRELAELRAENDRLRAELAELALTREKFRVLFEHSSDAHLILGDGGILDCNHAAIAMLRCSDKAQVLSLHPAVLSPEVQPDGRRSLEKSVEMDRTAHERGYHRFEWVHRRMDGEDFPVEVTLTPVTLPAGRVLLVAWHELTERRRREAALVEQLAVIEQQQAEIHRLSLPVLAVWDGVVMIPVLGALDDRAAGELTHTALEAIGRARARVVIVDLTGLTRADAATADHLARILGAAGLLGARGLVVGISPEVARAFVDVPLQRVRVLANLRDAIELCVRGEASPPGRAARAGAPGV